MRALLDSDRPKKKNTAYPRIFTNSVENMEKSIERLARWSLQKERTELQIKQLRAAGLMIRLRIELERLRFDRERFLADLRTEEKLDRVIEWQDQHREDRE